MTKAILGSRCQSTDPDSNFISSMRDNIKDVLPLPVGPEMMVKLPASIFRLICERQPADEGQENVAFFTSSAIFESISPLGQVSTTLVRAF